METNTETNNQAAEAAKKAAAETEAQIANLKNQVEDILRQYGNIQLKDATRGSQSLVKGFRNEKMVLPLANLQVRIEELEDGVNNALRGIQRTLAEQLQYVFQYVAKIGDAQNTLSTTVEALTALSNVTVEQLEAKVKEIEAKKAAEEEAKSDEQQGRKVVDRASQDGDTVKISFVGKIDGKEFAGGKGENFNLKLGSNQFIPGFEGQLVGKKAGETVEVNVTFPENYGNKELAGKAATFTTQVLAVKENTKKEEAKA